MTTQDLFPPAGSILNHPKIGTVALRSVRTEAGTARATVVDATGATHDLPLRDCLPATVRQVEAFRSSAAPAARRVADFARVQTRSAPARQRTTRGPNSWMGGDYGRFADGIRLMIQAGADRRRLQSAVFLAPSGADQRRDTRQKAPK